MQKLITTLTILNLTITPIFAQEKAGCFLMDDNQNLYILRELCPDAITPISPPRQENNTQPSDSDSENNQRTIIQETITDTVFFSVPIKRRVSGIPLIEVTFNGNQTFEMLLDTGATITTITPTMGQQLKLELGQTIPVATAGGIIQTQLSKVNSLQAGNLQVNNLLVSLTPSLPFGLLGQNFYGNYDLIIKENIVEFHPRNKNKN